MSLLHGWRASTKVLKLGFASIGVQIRSFSVRNPLPLSDLQNSAVDDKADPFYVVRKGSHVGIFSSLDDCQAQVSPSVLGPPVSVFKGYSLSKETEEYLASCGLKNALYSINSKDLKEDLFGTLVPCPFQQPIGAATLLDEIAELSTHNIFTESLNSTGSCILEFDGASKIKTRKAGAGAILRTKEGDVICRLREGLSFTTNNAAEYKALILGMKHALKKGFTQVHVQGDSQLVCMQVQGTWKTKNRNLAVLYDEAKTLKKKFASLTICHVERAVYFTDDEESTEKLFHDKTLGAALDSFDYLFCRRCLVFDCRLHGCSQNVIIPSEKQPFVIEQEENRKPCGSQCYLRGRKDAQDHDLNIPDATFMHEKIPKSVTKEICVSLPLESEDSNPDNERADPINYEGICTKISRLVTVSSETSERSKILNPEFDKSIVYEDPVKCLGKRKTMEEESSSKPIDEHFLVTADKKQKPLAFSDVSHTSEQLLGRFPISSNKCLDDDGITPDQLQKDFVDESVEYLSKSDVSAHKNIEMVKDIKSDPKKGPALKNSLATGKQHSFNCWNTMEKDLYLKGIEIFGKNSCLIARNLLSGLKTCLEVANYMFSDGASTVSRPSYTNLYQDDSGMDDQEYMEQEMPIRTRILRRRGRARKLKYTWKSAGHPSIRKRISNGKQQSCKQYTPCGCQQMCGKECSCMIDGTCCEKYCGCSKSCKNRFRGCHCAKSQCRSRQCPCFAAGRECDPDVCRNCWVSCGDGSLGEPLARGDGYQCGNMNLLLKQKKRILLARSDIAGWGAFIKNPVNKNDYLGEYTGELISHREADKRGKIYDRANSSFLFDLNDQFVLDAYRKGDKLKFANHSSNPNCYAKVMLVAGDHRVGIFAKERIEACEELFYDYRYGPDQAPAWARKPEGSKKDDSTTSHSRAHKVA